MKIFLWLIRKSCFKKIFIREVILQKYFTSTWVSIWLMKTFLYLNNCIRISYWRHKKNHNFFCWINFYFQSLLKFWIEIFNKRRLCMLTQSKSIHSFLSLRKKKPFRSFNLLDWFLIWNEGSKAEKKNRQRFPEKADIVLSANHSAKSYRGWKMSWR